MGINIFDEFTGLDDYPTQMLGNIVTEEQMRKSKKTQRPKHKFTQADMSKVERYEVEFKVGLNDEQVEKRNTEGLYNVAGEETGKTYKRILFNNLVTFFNFLTFGVAISLLVAGAGFSQVFFIIIILVNLAIGIWQEFKAKMTVDKLTLVSAPTAVVVRRASKMSIPITEVVLDDIIFLEQGKQIPADSILINGQVEVNESMLTGESVPISKKVGSTILGGSFVTAGKCYARVERVGSANYVQTLSNSAKRYVKPKSELQESIRRIIKVVSIIILPISALLIIFSMRGVEKWQDIVFSVAGAIIGMIPAGMFLLTSIALFVGQSRLARKNVLVQDLYCIEMLARVNILCLDKTGTITDGTMVVNEVIDVGKTKDGRTIDDVMSAFITATADNNQTAMALVNKFGRATKYNTLKPTKIFPFSSTRKMSVVEFADAGTYFLGAPEFVLPELGGEVGDIVEYKAKQGLRVLVLAHSVTEIKENDKLPIVRRPIALIVIEDHIREDVIPTIDWFKKNNVAVKVISGDNPATVSEVARRVGIEKAELYISLDGYSEQQVFEVANKYTVFGRVTPEQKEWLVKAMKLDRNNAVAMTGDGVNDILAMRASDCAITVANSAEAARNVAHLVLTKNDFNAMPDVVAEGRRVINNVEKSSSLFLMKTLMTILLTVIVLINIIFIPPESQWMSSYPLLTNNLLMLELFVIGIPSMFLALQANKNIIRGRFLFNVLSQSIPGGLALIAGIISLYIFRNSLGNISFIQNGVGDNIQTIIPLDNEQIISMMVLMIIFTGLVVLLRISQPLNSFRTILIISIFVLTLIGIYVLGNSFGIVYKPAFLAPSDSEKVLTLTQTLFITTVVSFAYAVVSIVIATLKRVKL